MTTIHNAYIRPENYTPPRSAEELIRRYGEGERYFSGANLFRADLSRAHLSDATLFRADLSGANLSRADLNGVNLSGATGLLVAREWLENNFDNDELGVTVFKAAGDTHYDSPDDWVFEPGVFLRETPNPCRTTSCGSGVSFGTLAFIQQEPKLRHCTIWRCRIHWLDLADVVVPYNTDGKARCGRLELIEELA